MRVLRNRLGLHTDASERGFSMIEVMVAMLIFAMLSMGVIFTMMSVLSVSRDARARQVAGNLAAEEIDRARDVANILELSSWSTGSAVPDPNDPSRPAGAITLNGSNFHVARTVEWVAASDIVGPCGATAASSTLRYKRVNVRVTWEGMRSTATPVQSDTVINPRAPINDPEKGTILISVLGAAGTGISGVVISATPSLSVPSSPTDASGCSYLFRVAPGTYNISLKKTGYVDEKNVEEPSKSVTVEKGKSVTASFQYDEFSRYNVTYPAPLGSRDIPSDLKTSFVNTLRTHAVGAAPQYKMHPSTSGYVVVAGDAESCLAADPRNWPSGAIGATNFVPPALPTYSADPFNPATAAVTMVPVTVTVNRNEYVKAVSVTGATPETTVFPACTTKVTFQFTRDSSSSSSSINRTLLLPYGAWVLHKGTSSSFAPSSVNRIGTVGGTSAPSSFDSSSKVVTLDPRIPDPAG